MIQTVTCPKCQSHLSLGTEFGTPAIGTPAIGTPAIGTPAIGTPAIGTPAIGTPAIGTPAIGTPAIGTPAIGTPAIGTPAIGTPAIGTPAIETSGEAEPLREGDRYVLVWEYELRSFLVPVPRFRKTGAVPADEAVLEAEPEASEEEPENSH